MQIKPAPLLSVWEVMVQVASYKDLITPFQVIVPEDHGEQIQSPLRLIDLDVVDSEKGMVVLIRALQRPTEQQYHALTAALYKKNIEQVLHILEQGLDFIAWLAGT